MNKEKEFSVFDSVVLPILITIGVNIAQIALRALNFLNAVMPNTYYIIALSAVSCLIVVLIKWTKKANFAVYQWIYRLLIIACYCIFVLFCILTIFILGNLAEESQLLFYLKLDVALLLALVAIVVPMTIWKKYEMQDKQTIKIVDTTAAEYATTGTCIPFRYNEEKNSITSYIIFNEAYDSDKWMFPGGHSFSGDEIFPSSIATSKAKEEAGLEVEIIDLYHSYDISPISEQEYADYFSVLNPPHYTYLFKLSPNVRCYNKRGHRYHYDMVYVAEIKNVLDQTAKFERAPIELPAAPLTLDQLHNYLTHSIDQYAQRKPRKERQKYFSFGRYIEKMLFEAHKDYIAYLSKEKEVK